MAELGQMSLNEFIENWDSDESSVEAVNNEAFEKNDNECLKTQEKKKIQNVVPVPQKKSDTSGHDAHQIQLDQLEEKDPEFYKFLQEEDASLLHFDDDDFDVDDSSSEDSDSGIYKPPAALEEASDSDIVSDDEIVETVATGTKKSKDSIMVTSSMIEEWKTKLMQEKSSFPALKELMKSFHSAVLRFTESEETDKSKTKKPKMKYKVLSSEKFNAIVGLCIQQVVPSLAKILNISPKQSFNQIKPQKSKSWVKVREVVQHYLNDVILLDQLLLEPTVLCAALRHTILLIPYFLCFPKVTKQLLKFLIKTWSGFDDESVRLISFLCINRIAKLDGDKYLEMILKQCYLAYVANCKFTTPTLLPIINFLKQTLCELFAIKPQVTYPIAFLYIRQLAIHLRKAMMVRLTANYKTVYNWQFMHSIGLWCRFVGNMYANEIIKPLAYPLIQVSLGTIDLIPTARYFPLRYRIIKDLIALMDCTDIYIPLLAYITKPVELAEFSKKSGMVSEPLNFATMLRLSNSQLKGSNYRSATIDEMYETLMAYLNTLAHTISFPEMVVPTMVYLKKYVKACKMPQFSKCMQQILSKIVENSKFIADRRSKVTFGVSDVGAVSRWESTVKEEGTPFHKHFANYKKSRQAETRQELADKNRNVEERLPQIDRKKFLEIAKAKERKELRELFGDDDTSDFQMELSSKLTDDNESSDVCKNRTAKKRKKSKKSEQNSCDVDDVSAEGSTGLVKEKIHPRPSKIMKIDDQDEPDVVEDFHFSSDDD